MVLCALLGLLDMFAAWMLFSPGWLPAVAFVLGVAMVIKAASSLMGGAAGSLMIVAMGLIDMLSGISLLLGWGIPFLWLPLGIKGFYSFIMGW